MTTIGPSFTATTLPQARITMPDGVYYHMIHDHELSSLMRGETSALGNVGYACLGAAISLTPAVAQIVQDMQSNSPPQITWSVFASLLVFTGTAIGAAFALTMHTRAKGAAKDLAKEIRSREKVAWSEAGRRRSTGVFLKERG